MPQRIQELERQRRVADQLISMHSILRDRYRFRAGILDAIVLVTSVILITMAFADPLFSKWFEWGSIDNRISIGILAVFNFLAAMWGWRFDWKGQAEQHSKAADAYSRFKLELVLVLSGGRGVTSTEFKYQTARWVEIGNSHTQIPDSQFAPLKSRHLHKVQMSKMLDEFPGLFTFPVSIYVRIMATLKALIKR